MRFENQQHKMKNESEVSTRSTPWGRTTLGSDFKSMFEEHEKQHAVSCEPPRRPARQRSFPGKASLGYSTKRHDNGNGDGDDRETRKGENIHKGDSSISISNEKEDALSSSEHHLSNSTSPCSMIYCCSTNFEDEISSNNSALLTEDRIRAFLHDYYMDYNAMRGQQSLDAWSCFAEEYYGPGYQFIRPSGNPLNADSLVKVLVTDMIILSIQMVSIDSITVLSSSSNSAIVTFTCDHCFEYKGTLNEDRAVMTCVLEMVRGEIKIMHEHRTTGRPIPRETRWQSEY